VIISSPVFIILAFSFAKPQSPRDWRSFGAFSAFVVALFAEMYGFPLTIYLLAGWLTSRFPGIDWMTHDGGHLLEMTLGWRTDPHFGPFHVLSFIFIGGGFWLLAAAWRVLYRAQRAHHLVTTYCWQVCRRWLRRATITRQVRNRHTSPPHGRHRSPQARCARSI
jgi:protein-S-isoprenylcysteine O-methyltransferase Ste14